MTTNKPDIDGLERLLALREAGALTQDEFDTQKRKLLATSNEGNQDAIDAKPAAPQQGPSSIWLWVGAGILIIMLYQMYVPPDPRGYDRSRYVPCPSINGSTPTSLCHR